MRFSTFDFAITVAARAVDLAGRSSATRTGLTLRCSKITGTLAPRTFSLAATATDTTSKYTIIVLYSA